MIFSLADVVVAIALLIACLRGASMHRALKQLRGYHQDYQSAFEKTAAALAAVRAALSERNSREYELSTRLVDLIEEARAKIEEIDARMPKLDFEPPVPIELAARIEKEEIEKRTPGTAVIGASHTAFAFCRRVARPMVEAIAEV